MNSDIYSRADQMLRRLLLEPGLTPDSDEIKTIAEAYPYLSIPDILALGSGDCDNRSEIMARIALNAPDPDTLFRLIDPEGKELAKFMPAAQPKPAASTTDSAIDLFLNTYGHSDPREEAILEKMIFNPVPDYSALLEREAAAEAAAIISPEEPVTRQQDVAQPQPAPAPKPLPEPPAPKPAPVSPAPRGSFSESLAMIFIKRGRYDKAYEIIHQLSLNNPKKSVYFADQLRFLRKIMLNQELKNQNH